MQSGRILMVIAFVAAAARLLLDAPVIVPYAGAAAALAWLLLMKARFWWRARAYKAANPTTTAFDDWAPCPATIALDKHTVCHCAGRKGHEGVHGGTPEIEWLG